MGFDGRFGSEHLALCCKHSVNPGLQSDERIDHYFCGGSLQLEREMIATLLLLLFQFTIPMHTAAPHGSSAPTIAHIQGCENYAGGAQTSVSCTMGAAVGAGHLLYLCSQGVSSVSITWTGDTGTQTADITNFSVNGSAFASCIYILTSVGGGTTFTATETTSYVSINVEEFSITGTRALDVSGAGAQSFPTSSTAVSGDSITPTANGDLVIGFITANNGPVITQGTGWTAGSQSGLSSLMEYQQQTTAAPILTTGTLASSQLWFAHTISFK